jgi:hypothetical protein
MQILNHLVRLLFGFDLLQELYPIFFRDGLKSSKQHKKPLLLFVCLPESFRNRGDLVPESSEFGMRDYDDILSHRTSSTYILPPGTFRASTSGNVKVALVGDSRVWRVRGRLVARRSTSQIPVPPTLPTQKQ